ncbi:MAG: HesA/MoeB/ThiF family protein [Duncaniella sp.]|nr:HesA/MoeB/ThiF family protein [Duncaniella sp.]
MDDKNRYSRQIKLKELGEEGQRRLEKGSVLIVGTGGLGSVVATYLNGAGIGRLGLVDNDTVSVTNLHRQFLYTENERGKRKAECAAEFLSARSGHTRLTPYSDALNEENALKLIDEYDIVVDCTDNFQTRFLIDDTCRQLGKSWVHGAIGEFEGRVAVFTPECGPGFSDLYPEREYLCGLKRTEAGVMGPVPGVVGSIQAMEAIKLIAGMNGQLSGRLFTINLLTLETNLIDI